MRYTFIALITVILLSCNSSGKKKDKKKETTISAVKMEAMSVPASIVLAELEGAWQWTDKSGENILVTSYVEPFDDTAKSEYGEEGQTAKLYAAQYVKNNDKYELLWKDEQIVRSCPFDITCHFIKDAVTVTDIDKDGIGEATIACRLACRSDVSPSNMKLIMYEGTSKYFLNGYSWLKASPEDSFTVTEKDVNLETLPNYKPDEDYMMLPGRYESEKGFASAPPEFLNYARQQWMKFVKERME